MCCFHSVEPGKTERNELAMNYVLAIESLAQQSQMFSRQLVWCCPQAQSNPEIFPKQFSLIGFKWMGYGLNAYVSPDRKQASTLIEKKHYSETWGLLFRVNGLTGYRMPSLSRDLLLCACQYFVLS